MIVREVMTTKLVTVTSDDPLSHAANLFRQYQFHHLPVIRSFRSPDTKSYVQKTLPVLEGLLSSEDIDLAAANGTQESHSQAAQAWQDRRIGEVMHEAPLCITPITSVAAAAQMLIERGLNCLPVVEYDDAGKAEEEAEHPAHAILVGLLTRSDLLMALARSLGAFEPGMELLLPLPAGNLIPLAQTLEIAAELHIQIHSVLVGPQDGNVPRVATVRLGTINPAPLLVRLRRANIVYELAGFQREDIGHV